MASNSGLYAPRAWCEGHPHHAVASRAFFIGSITVMCALIPWRQAGVGESPFVLAFNGIGIPYAGDIMNFVVLTAVLSASNSGLYASTRMVWSMGNEGMIPRWFAKTNRRGVPMLALCAAMAGGLLALLPPVIAASTVYLVLVALSGLSAVVVWIAIAYCQIVFRRRWLEPAIPPANSNTARPAIRTCLGRRSSCAPHRSCW